jgi:hypothetical protein
MATDFRPYEPDQPYLLPQLPREWLPEGHLVLAATLADHAGSM